MILVLTGTHEQPFDRLVRAAEVVARDTGEEVVVQRGTSREPAPHCRVVDLLPHGEVLELMARARVVITHGGPATILEAARHGRPVVVPRDPAFGEHVDDHQLRFCRRLQDRVHLVVDPQDLVQLVQGLPGDAEEGVGLTSDSRTLGRSVAAFERAVHGLGQARSTSMGQRIRATIMLFSRRPPRRS